MRTNTTKEKILTLLEQNHLLGLEAMQEAITDVDFSTVYRNIQQLVQAGVVKKVVLDSKVAVYELASHHHDHFVCEKCERVEVVDVPVTSLVGKQVIDVVVRGRCESCVE